LKRSGKDLRIFRMSFTLEIVVTFLHIQAP